MVQSVISIDDNHLLFDLCFCTEVNLSLKVISNIDNQLLRSFPWEVGLIKFRNYSKKFDAINDLRGFSWREFIKSYAIIKHLQLLKWWNDLESTKKYSENAFW